MKKKIVLGILFVLVILLSFYFDAEIVRGIFLIRGDFLNDVFMGITFVSSSVIIFFFLTSLFLWKEHKRKWILPLWISLGLSVGISFLLKFFVKRLRPFQLGIVSVMPVLEKASHVIWNFSFPSFHAMLGFCAVPILSKEFPKFKYVWIGFASLIAFSRIYFGLHFLSDVLVGGAIGYLIGFGILKLEREKKIFERVYRKVFGKKK